ncbi:hypothetical protein [Aliidiomarina sanyensis]|uniref:Toxin co-regulated pilus biosynthesis protein Q C-terminal domain-containing protein n=1 Tax=Aliidiomarina sanyensis TaxID=1249555 RepID=A0A432WDK9_9GAMM|nr:hypothetical protein [Aliidiomarina sanyensis]RUO30501.1 hypothetical protein CWE11_09005 [Aliidiomarina sanyensis]
MVSNQWPVWAVISLLLFYWSSPVAGQSYAPCPSLTFHAPHGTERTPTAAQSANNVSVTLRPALLRPQLEALLKTQWGVQNVVWYAAQEHYWPTHYEMHAANENALLEQLLTPYRLRVTFHHNHTAVVNYLPGGAL